MAFSRCCGCFSVSYSLHWASILLSASVGAPCLRLVQMPLNMWKLTVSLSLQWPLVEGHKRVTCAEKRVHVKIGTIIRLESSSYHMNTNMKSQFQYYKALFTSAYKTFDTAKYYENRKKTLTVQSFKTHKHASRQIYILKVLFPDFQTKKSSPFPFTHGKILQAVNACSLCCLLRFQSHWVKTPGSSWVCQSFKNLSIPVCWHVVCHVWKCVSDVSKRSF